MEFTSSRGVRLRIGRLPRKVLDDFAAAHPLPVPPTVEKTVFGGVKEQVEDTDDEGYQAELFEYHLCLAHDQMGMLLPSIEIVGPWDCDGKFTELREAGAVDTSTPERERADYLVFVALSDEDMRTVVDEIFYQSTVTPRGIREAERLYNVTWLDEDIYAWQVRRTPGKFSSLFDDRDAAVFAHYKWNEFCELTGPEQSAIVAHYRLRTRLENLASRMDTK